MKIKLKKIWIKRRRLIYAAVICLFAAMLAAVFLFRVPEAGIEPGTHKKEYYRYELVEVQIKVNGFGLRNRFIKEGIPYYVITDKLPVTTIGNRRNFTATFDRESNLWVGLWPCPWNADTGEYKVVLDTAAVRDLDPGTRISNNKFKIVRRQLPKLQKGWSVLTFENTHSPPALKIRDENNELGDWKNIFRWANFINADSFLYLAAETAYHDAKLDENFPWSKHKINRMNMVGAEAKKQGLSFGAYVMVYLTFGDRKLAPEKYTYAVDYRMSTDELFTTRSISLNDEKRVDDLIEILKILDSFENVDYVGIDYIRNALGGYELVDDFVRDMDVEVPEEWENLSFEDRMRWAARKKIRRTDMRFIDQWQWWRAHKSAAIIADVIKRSGIKKPLWAFTLSWDKGWEHGQDPVMFADAGVDYDGVMLYECDRRGFDSLIRAWNSYLKKGDANILGGNVLDWPLHQRTLQPSGPHEYYERSVIAIDKLYNDGICDAAFVHDLHRALWGRRGPYSTVEWMLSAGKVITHLKSSHGVLAFDCTMDITEPHNCVITIKEKRSGAENIKLNIYANKEVSFDYEPDSILEMNGQKEIVVEIPYVVRNTAFERANNHFLAVRLEYELKGKTESLVLMEYLNNQKTAEKPAQEPQKENGDSKQTENNGIISDNEDAYDNQ